MSTYNFVTCAKCDEMNPVSNVYLGYLNAELLQILLYPTEILKDLTNMNSTTTQPSQDASASRGHIVREDIQALVTS